SSPDSRRRNPPASTAAAGSRNADRYGSPDPTSQGRRIGGPLDLRRVPVLPATISVRQRAVAHDRPTANSRRPAGDPNNGRSRAGTVALAGSRILSYDGTGQAYHRAIPESTTS